jgi:hypothetical protein
MNALQIVLLTFAGIIAFVLVYIEYRSNGFGGYYEKRQRKLRHKNQKNKISIEVHNDVKENIQYSDNVIKVNSDSKDNMSFS